MNIFRVFIISTLVLTTACAKETRVRSHASYERILKNSSGIAFLPSQAEVHSVGVGSRTRVYDYESSLEEIINREVPPLLREKGYKVKLFRKVDIHNAKLSRQVLNLRDKHNAGMRDIYKPLFMKEEQALNTSKNFGKEVQEIGNATDSEILVLVDYSGAVQTNGARAMGFAMDVLFGSRNSSNVDSSDIMITIVDARTGDLLWSNISTQITDIYSSAFDNLSSQEKIDIKRVNYMASSALSTLPNKNALDAPKTEKSSK